MSGCLKCSQKVHVWKLKIRRRRNASEIVGICGNNTRTELRNRSTLKMIASVLSVLFFSAISTFIFFSWWRRIVEKVERRKNYHNYVNKLYAKRVLRTSNLSFLVLKSTYYTLLLLFITLYTVYFRCLVANVRRNLNSYPLLTTFVP